MKTDIVHTSREENFNFQPGFALIVTLSLMILLTIIAVGLLTLSSISLRSSAQNEDLRTARSNARMALMLAIGDLQRQAGPDTRVTARADILAAANPRVVGVWKSWEGSNHTATGTTAGRPISPGVYKTKKESRFLRWLVSEDPTGQNDLRDSANPPAVAKTPTSVALVGENTLASTDVSQQVHLLPVRIKGQRPGAQNLMVRGGYAWWVSGENQKAHLPRPATTAPTTDGSWASVAKSHSISDPLPFGLEKLLEEPASATKVISLNEADLLTPSANPAAPKISTLHFHDLSSVSTGLLTNTATGGWRKDLSLFTEGYSEPSWPSSNLPLFRLTPDTDTSCSIPKGNASNSRAAKSMLYPWSDYRGSSAVIPIYQHGAVASWENLKDYTLLYQKNSSHSFASTSYRIDNNSPDGIYNFLHKVRLLPVVARVQWVFSHTAGPPPPKNPPHPATHREARLLVTPVITLWNPYNVKISTPSGFRFNIPKPLPCVLKYNVNGTTYNDFRSLSAGSTNYPSSPLAATDNFLYTIPDSIVLNPGQTRVYSATTTVAAGGAALSLSPGFRKTSGHYFSLRDNANQPVVVPSTSTIKVAAKFDNSYNDLALGVGIYMDMQSIADSNLRHLAYRMVYTPEVAAKTYPELKESELAAATSLSSVEANPIPFLSTMFGARLASNTHIPAKGFLQTSPLVNYTAMGGKDTVESTIQHHYGGSSHPVNSPFDYSFVAHAGLDSYFPNLTGDSGYIVSGFTSGNGLSRCIAAEIPSRPLASLAELQHWDLRYENPIPPYAFNLIGNSDATPLIPSDKVFNSADDDPRGVNLQHDDSYCANHLLFDDWFCSSLAAGNPTGFGLAAGMSAGGVLKNLEKPFTEFLKGTTPLPNFAYKLQSEDLAAASSSTAAITKLYNEHVNKPDAWQRFASRLEVEGMFNVNSTSVVAWRALLGHARKVKIPYTNGSGGTTLSSAGDHILSRSSIAGDTKAGTPGLSGAFSAASEFTGYRELDGATLDVFAQLIVDQVRQRGPFLSLAEFVNRQLSSDNLALAGTIQAALNEMEKGSSANIYSKLIAGMDAPPGKQYATENPPEAAAAEYKYPEAAKGISIYGIPGWTRQADVLRPIAPVLSARDDTFIIRAYGDARVNTKGGDDPQFDKVLASAVCEVVIRRTRNYCNPEEAADLATPSKNPVNKVFGRRFEIVSFRWLSPSEI